MSVRCLFIVAAVALIGLGTAAEAQQSSIGAPVPPLGEGPWVFDTAEQHKIRVSVVTKELVHPWAIAFLPSGNMLITERPGRLRIVRGNVLDPQPISGVPTVRTDGNGGLMDVALHPEFAENRLVYLTYTKPMENGRGAPALARGRLDGEHALTDVHDLIVTEAYEGNSGLNGRVVFGQDGKVYMSTGGRVATVSQDMMSLRGKVLRLNDDGTVPDDNPFVNHHNHRPEIYTFGHRNTLGLILNPLTGDLWQHENGPNGGDEINILSRGLNYGWPIVSFGRDYSGARLYEPTREGLETPLVVWLPAIAVAGMTVYTSDRFPAWQGNVFVGSLREGGIPGTGHLERIVFNEKTEEMRRESMLTELRQRIREVREGPDGFLYLLTDEDDGALLRIEPTP